MTDDIPSVGQAARFYVIGDIHGRSDLLDQIVEKISADLLQNPAGNCLTVTLGDYVDRGPDSRGVLDRLARNPFPTDYLALKGNHEGLLEDFLEDPSIGSAWRGIGGLETIYSYGVPVNALIQGRGFSEARDLLAAAMPTEHVRFLQSLKMSFESGNLFFCHAGVRPSVALDMQKAEDLLWIRSEFLSSTADFGKLVIHGHSPTEWPEVRDNRINIDTGAFATGRLTCLVAEHERPVRFLFTG